MEGSNSIKSIQMGLITFFAQTGVGIITIPSLLAREVGHDGWISMLLTGIITIILSMLVIWLLKRYKSKDMYDINALIFGKFIGAGFNFIILLYLFVTTVAGASLFTNFIRITLLQQTPLWVLAPFVSLPSIYLVWQGLKSMGRFLYASLFNYIVIIIFLLLLFKEIRFSFLMPLGDAGFTRILYSIKTSFLAYTGFEIIAFLYPHITDKDKALKWHVIAISASIIFFVFVVGISTAIFGENLLSILNLPFYNLSRVYNAPIVE
ncbi:MAG TPA: GerAB/ArcD/ProY family transporter, partial [Clostridia bacterium]